MVFCATVLIADILYSLDFSVVLWMAFKMCVYIIQILYIHIVWCLLLMQMYLHAVVCICILLHFLCNLTLVLMDVYFCLFFYFVFQGLHMSDFFFPPSCKWFKCSKLQNAAEYRVSLTVLWPKSSSKWLIKWNSIDWPLKWSVVLSLENKWPW